MVDWPLWNGQRKLKKADRSSSGGHLGCSSSYNSSEYQNDIKINTQAREQTLRRTTHEIYEGSIADVWYVGEPGRDRAEDWEFNLTDMFVFIPNVCCVMFRRAYSLTYPSLYRN